MHILNNKDFLWGNFHNIKTIQKKCNNLLIEKFSHYFKWDEWQPNTNILHILLAGTRTKHKKCRDRKTSQPNKFYYIRFEWLHCLSPVSCIFIPKLDTKHFYKVMYVWFWVIYACLIIFSTFSALHCHCSQPPPPPSKSSSANTCTQIGAHFKHRDDM